MKKIFIINLVIIFIYVIGFLLFHFDNTSYDITQIDQLVEITMKKTSTPGTALVFFDNNSMEYHTYGYANKETKINVNNATNFEIGSTTKAFTALAVLMLEDEGKINRKDNVSKYISWFKPKFKGSKQEVTVEQLLTHKSGIPAWTISTIPSGSSTKLLETTVKNVASINLQSKPGSEHQYATINYDILALIIEKVTGKSFQDYVTDNILMPLGMENSYFEVGKKELSSVKAQGYKYEMMQAVSYNAPTYYGNIAAGYLVTNLKDISKWLAAQLGILNNIPENVKQAIDKSHVYDDNISEKYYWAGWNITPKEQIINHGGSNPNFTSQVYIDLDNKKAVFVMCNINGMAATEIGSDIFKMLNDESVKNRLLIGVNEFIDFICILICIISIEFFIKSLFLKEKRYTKHNIIRSATGIGLITMIIIWPIILHCTYSMLWVWYTKALFIAEALIVSCIVLWLIKSKQMIK